MPIHLPEKISIREATIILILRCKLASDSRPSGNCLIIANPLLHRPKYPVDLLATIKYLIAQAWHGPTILFNLSTCTQHRAQPPDQSGNLEKLLCTALDADDTIDQQKSSLVCQIQ